MRITVRNQEFTVEPNHDRTLLKTTVDDQDVEASTLPLLIQAVTRLLEVPRASIPVMSMVTPDSWSNKTSKILFRTGILTGVHARNGNLLVHWDDSKTASQARSTYGSEVLKSLTPEQQGNLQRLFDIKKGATEAWERERRKYGIDETLGRKLTKEYHASRGVTPPGGGSKKPPLKLK